MRNPGSIDDCRNIVAGERALVSKVDLIFSRQDSLASDSPHVEK